MPIYFIHLINTAVFAGILVAVVPKKEIRRLSIYGIIFGGIMDILMLIMGNATGLYGWINYGPFGFMGIPIFSAISWAIFYILFFYFLPKRKPLNYVYIVTGIAFSVLYTNIVINLGVFQSSNRILLPLIAFVFWYSIATWGYYKLTGYFQRQPHEKIVGLRLTPQPAKKIEGKKNK